MANKKMIKYLTAVFIFFILYSPLIRSQQGAYIAPVLKYTTINGQGSNLLGIKGGWVINNSIVIGAEYYALNTNVAQNWIDPFSGVSTSIKFSTGGLNFEYIFIHENIISASAEMFMGGAGINLQPSAYYGADFLVWEPQLNVTVNLKWFHLSFGLSYRTTSALDIYHIDGSGNFPPLDFPIKNLRGWTGNISFVFGKY
jgi:hypothetical protein